MRYLIGFAAGAITATLVHYAALQLLIHAELQRQVR